MAEDKPHDQYSGVLPLDDVHLKKMLEQAKSDWRNLQEQYWHHRSGRAIPDPRYSLDNFECSLPALARDDVEPGTSFRLAVGEVLLELPRQPTESSIDKHLKELAELNADLYLADGRFYAVLERYRVEIIRKLNALIQSIPSHISSIKNAFEADGVTELVSKPITTDFNLGIVHLENALRQMEVYRDYLKGDAAAKFSRYTTTGDFKVTITEDTAWTKPVQSLYDFISQYSKSKRQAYSVTAKILAILFPPSWGILSEEVALKRVENRINNQKR